MGQIDLRVIAIFSRCVRCFYDFNECHSSETNDSVVGYIRSQNVHVSLVVDNRTLAL